MDAYPQNDFELDFSIDTIKKILEMLLNTPGHTDVKINPMLNTYKFGYVDLLSVGIINIQLTSIAENKTKLKITTMPAVGSRSEPAVLLRVQNKFLDTLTGYLSGTLSTDKLAAKAKIGKGCLLLFAAIVISTFAVIVFAISLI